MYTFIKRVEKKVLPLWKIKQEFRDLWITPSHPTMYNCIYDCIEYGLPFSSISLSVLTTVHSALLAHFCLTLLLFTPFLFHLFFPIKNTWKSIYLCIKTEPGNQCHSYNYIKIIVNLWVIYSFLLYLLSPSLSSTLLKKYSLLYLDKILIQLLILIKSWKARDRQSLEWYLILTNMHASCWLQISVMNAAIECSCSVTFHYETRRKLMYCDRPRFHESGTPQSFLIHPV